MEQGLRAYAGDPKPLGCTLGVPMPSVDHVNKAEIVTHLHQTSIYSRPMQSSVSRPHATTQSDSITMTDRQP
jgi:hypothetical protein